MPKKSRKKCVYDSKQKNKELRCNEIISLKPNAIFRMLKKSLNECNDVKNFFAQVNDSGSVIFDTTEKL